MVGPDDLTGSQPEARRLPSEQSGSGGRWTEFHRLDLGQVHDRRAPQAVDGDALPADVDHSDVSAECCGAPCKHGARQCERERGGRRECDGNARRGESNSEDRGHTDHQRSVPPHDKPYPPARLLLPLHQPIGQSTVRCKAGPSGLAALEAIDPSSKQLAGGTSPRLQPDAEVAAERSLRCSLLDVIEPASRGLDAKGVALPVRILDGSLEFVGHWLSDAVPLMDGRLDCSLELGGTARRRRAVHGESRSRPRRSVGTPRVGPSSR